MVGNVPYEVSIFYRFLLAGTCMWLIVWCRKHNVRIPFRQHPLMFFIGLLIFSMNYIFFYRAARFISSGMLSVLFSSSVVMIMINSRLLFKRPISKSMFFGGCLGVSGICLIFYQDLQAFSFQSDSCIGLLFALLGAYCFSLGNEILFYCSKKNISVITCTAWGMLYGVIITMLTCMFKGFSFAISFEYDYLIALFYLAIPGSVAGYLVYLSLVKKLGQKKQCMQHCFFQSSR